MTGRTALSIAAVGAALAAPGNAAAVDHVTLFVSPTKLSQPGWKLSAAVVGPRSPGARETFGISLTRALPNGTGEEQHGLRAAPAGTVTFDGRSGRWRARIGTLVAIDMTVTATGPAREIGESQGCRGSLASVPVSLRGSFVLRTGTAYFGSIRRVRVIGLGDVQPQRACRLRGAGRRGVFAVDRSHRGPTSLPPVPPRRCFCPRTRAAG